MRKDLAQLLCETPRFNRRESYHLYRHTKKDYDLESAPCKESIRSPYYDRKEFSEYFPPLEGMLRKNVGRPWNQVYSEVTEALHGGGAVIAHVRLHLLRDFVILQPLWVGGKPHYPYHSFRGLRNGDPVPLSDVHYVDQMGILLYAEDTYRKSKWRYTPKPTFERVPCDKDSAYYKLEGVWYRVYLKDLPSEKPGSVVYDILLKKSFYVAEYSTGLSRRTWTPQSTVWRWSNDTRALSQVHGVPRYAYRKTQLGSREIRRAGLR